MPISVSMIILSSQLVVPVADRLPVFDIARSCKLDLAATAGLTNANRKRPASTMKTGRGSSS